MSNYALENGLAALSFARRVTLGLLEGIPKTGLLHQPTPSANHAMWIAGHITWDDDLFLTALKPRPSKLPKKWVGVFRSGSVPHGDASAYPDYEELLGQMSAQREELTAWFRSMGTEQLARPLPEDLRSFAESYGVLMSTLAWHEGVHAGQLTVIRKDLGLEPMFG